MSNAVIVETVRSPMARAKPTGALASVHPAELLSQVIIALIERTGIDPGLVDDVIVGCVTQSGEQSATPGRQAWLAAGYPVHVPSTTVERKCGSGQQAVDFAVNSVVAGAYDIVIAAGIESMSRIPIGSSRGDADPFGPRVRQRFPDLVPQGVSAELVADKWALTREELDTYSARSHQLAQQAVDAGLFDDEIVPIVRPDGSSVAADATIRGDTTVAKLATLPPAFVTETMVTRFPSIDWKITAGSSSQLTDGAAAALIMTEECAARFDLHPRARIVASAVCGDDPTLMLTGPIPATRKVLARGRLSLGDLDAIEVNEAFASVPLAWLREFNADPSLLNPRGGAIALGHPLGASGTRILTTLMHHLQATGGRFGLQTMCEAGGMANAFIVENLGSVKEAPVN